MKYRIKKETIIDTYTLVNKVSQQLESVSMYTGKSYTVEFIQYNRHLKVTDKTNNLSYYHPIKSVRDADETLIFYKGYAQAIYDLYNNTNKNNT